MTSKHKKSRSRSAIQKKARKPGKSKDPQDDKLCLTKGQLCNIVSAAENKKGHCKKAKKFIKELKEEIHGNGRTL